MNLSKPQPLSLEAFSLLLPVRRPAEMEWFDIHRDDMFTTFLFVKLRSRLSHAHSVGTRLA